MESKKIINDTIEYILDEAINKYIDEEFDKIEDEVKNVNFNFSAQHISAIEQIINGSYKDSEYKIKVRRPLRYSKRMILVSIITMIIIASTTLGVNAVKLRILNYFINIQNQYTEFKYTESDNTKSNNPFNVTLHYIPDNYIIYDINTTNKNYNITYKNNNKYFSITKTNIVDNVQIDTEDANTKYIYINNNKAFVSIKNDKIIILWSSLGFLYTIDGNTDYNTLINIAKNIE